MAVIIVLVRHASYWRASKRAWHLRPWEPASQSQLNRNVATRQDGRRNGCPTKQRRAVAQALEDLLALRVTYCPPGGYKKGRPLPPCEPLTVSVIELAGAPFTVITAGGTTVTVSWPLRLGAWAQRSTLPHDRILPP